MTDPVIVEDICRMALHIAETAGTVTADDVREAMPRAPYKRSTFGAAFRVLVQEGRLASVGWERSRHKANHGRKVQVYEPRIISDTTPRVRECAADQQGVLS